MKCFGCQCRLSSDRVEGSLNSISNNNNSKIYRASGCNWSVVSIIAMDGIAPVALFITKSLNELWWGINSQYKYCLSPAKEQDSLYFEASIYKLANSYW